MTSDERWTLERFRRHLFARRLWLRLFRRRFLCDWPWLAAYIPGETSIMLNKRGLHQANFTHDMDEEVGVRILDKGETAVLVFRGGAGERGRPKELEVVVPWGRFVRMTTACRNLAGAGVADMERLLAQKQAELDQLRIDSAPYSNGNGHSNGNGEKEGKKAIK